MKEVELYIKNNWIKTVKEPNSAGGTIEMPKPFTVPSISEGFHDFFYWDTYFTNLGLIEDGYIEQAENNLDNMAFFIQKIGYVPNANVLLDRTQPPLFTMGVYDLYEKVSDIRIIKKYIIFCVKEYEFFQKERLNVIGLNSYKNNVSKEDCLKNYAWLSVRVNEFRKTDEEKIKLVNNLFSIAESGWDFTPRFNTRKERFCANKFANLDLNCILYDVERKISKMYSIMGLNSEAKKYDKYSKSRKTLIERYMQEETSGIYYDYNFIDKEFSMVLSAVSFYPYAVGISTEKESALKVLRKLEFEYGLSSCEYRGEDEEYLQWDYPCMWPSNVYFAYIGLKNIGLKEEADRIKQKYIKIVETVFKKTGCLWEKYDAVKCDIGESKEYKTAKMLGWTAGVYKYLMNN